MRRINFLDGLKGLAIIAVVYQHTLATIVTEKTGTRLFFGFGYLSVAMFFIISGFLLYLPYANGKSFSFKKDDLRNFYTKKINRLYMPLLFCLFILVVFVYKLEPHYIKSAILSMTMMNQFVPSEFTPSINGVLWFLPVFIMFILLFPLLMLCVNKFGILKVFLIILLFSFLVRLFGAQYYAGNILLSPVKDSVLGRADDFVLGMALAQLYATKKYANFYKIRYLVFGWLAFLVSNIVIMIFLRNKSEYFFVAIANNFVQISFALFILFTASNIYYKKLIENRYIVKIGKMSYSIFLWNIPLIAIILTVSTLKRAVVFIFFLAIVSYFTYDRVENYKSNKNT